MLGQPVEVVQRTTADVGDNHCAYGVEATVGTATVVDSHRYESNASVVELRKNW